MLVRNPQHCPSFTPVEVIDDDGHGSRMLEITPREAILMGQAVVGQEEYLVNDFDPGTIQAAEIEMKQVSSRAIGYGWMRCGLVALGTDADMAARHYVLNIRGKTLDHSFIPSASAVERPSDASDDAVRISPEELFADDDDDDPSLELDLNVDVHDIAANAQLSREGREALCADLKDLTDHGIAIAAITARLAALALQRQMKGLPDDDGFRQELADIEHKLSEVTTPPAWTRRIFAIREARLPRIGRYATIAAAAAMVRFGR